MPVLKNGINAFWLKIIAIIAMTLDHIGYALFPHITIFRIIGRIAFPIFAFLIAEGYKHTKNIRKYELRLFVFALISCLPFYLVCGKWQNVFFTLLGGLIALDIADRIKQKWTGVLCMLAIAVLTYECDWGFGGVITVFVFGKIKDKDFAVPIGVSCSAALYVLKRFFAESVLGRTLFVFSKYTLIFYSLLSIPILMTYNGKQGCKIKYFFYIFYPAHLTLIWLIDYFII